MARRRAERRDTYDLARYLDNNPDVAAAFGTNSAAATIHYIQQDFFEGLTDDPPPGLPSRFDGPQYIASDPDVISHSAPTASTASGIT